MTTENRINTLLCPSLYLLAAPLMMVLAVLACGTAVSELAHYTCPTSLPPTAPAYLPGTALAPATAPPTPTAFEIVAPQAFYKQDAVYAGRVGRAVYLRFRLSTVQVQAASGQQLVTWQLTVSNLGSATFDTVPPAQMSITQLGGQVGVWRTSEAAMARAGFEREDYTTLTPDRSRTYRLAALTPVGRVEQLTFILSDAPRNTLVWLNQTNPYCGGD